MTPGTSTIVYVGAHRDGSDGEKLHSMYGSRVYMYEPVGEFFADLQAKFGARPGYTLLNLGLGEADTIITLPKSRWVGASALRLFYTLNMPRPGRTFVHDLSRWQDFCRCSSVQPRRNMRHHRDHIFLPLLERATTVTYAPPQRPQ